MRKNIRKFMLLWAALAAGLTFTACGDDDNGDGAEMVDDGWYIMGEATALSEIKAEGRMVSGLNENAENAPQTGLYEKYIALEAGKTFSIVKVAGTTHTTIGADAVDTMTATGENWSISGGAIVQFGTYKDGGTTFTVPESRLYQVAIYEATKAIAIIPVRWETNGLGDPYELTQSAFSKTSMTFSLENVTAELGGFKIKSYNGWKFNMTPDLSETEAVKVNCNFGPPANGFKFDGSENAVLPGGVDIAIDLTTRGIYTVTLTWTLGAGWSHTLKMTKTDDLTPIDPAATVFSLIGDAFNNGDGTPASWDYDLDFTYDAASSTATVSKYTLSNVSLIAGKGFKVRKSHDWGINYGYEAAKILGDAANFEDDGGNIKVLAAKTYSTVVFSYDWANNTNWSLTFTE